MRGGTRVHRAVIQDDATALRELIEQGASLRECDPLGYTPRELALHLGRAECQTILGCRQSHPEALCGVPYAPHLRFPDYQTLWRVSEQCDKALDEGWITGEMCRLGARYAAMLRGGLVAPVEVRWIDEEVGFGVFALEDLEKGAFIGEFTGEVLRHRLWHFGVCDYRFRFPTARFFWRKYTIDAERMGNETRFINHNDDPNCEAIAVYADHLMHIVFVTLERIAAGTQLCFDYGPEYWKRRDPPKAFILD